MAQPIDSTTPTTASHSPAHIAARIATPTELPISYPAHPHTHLHPGNPNPSPTITAVPIQSPQGSWTSYYPPPATSTLPLSSSTESGGSKSIVGPVVGGSVVGLVIVILVTLLVVKKRKKRKEARKRRLDFLEGRHPAGHFTFGGVGVNSDGTAAIAAGGGYGSSSAVPGAGHRQAPHKEFSYSAHQQHQQQNQQESDDQDEQEYDPYFAHRQRQQRLQMQAAREYYAALQLQQRQIQGYFPEARSNQYRHSQQFTPATSAIRRSYDGSLSPAMTQITAQSSYPAYLYPQRPPPPATRGLRRHSSPWTMSPSQHQYHQSTAGIPEVGRRVSSFEKGAHNASIDSPPTKSSHNIAEITPRSPC